MGFEISAICFQSQCLTDGNTYGKQDRDLRSHLSVFKGESKGIMYHFWFSLFRKLGSAV